MKVSIDLGLEGLGEHLLGTLAGDLVEVEHELLLTRGLVVVYSVHRRILPFADGGASAYPFDCSKGRYTTSLGKSSIHSFLQYLMPRSEVVMEGSTAPCVCSLCLCW